MAAPIFEKIACTHNSTKLCLTHVRAHITNTQIVCISRCLASLAHIHTRNRLCTHIGLQTKSGKSTQLCGPFPTPESRRHFNRPASEDEDDRQRIKGFVFPIQSPIKWFWKQIGLLLFQKVDPHWDKHDFIEGAKQAVSMVTHQFSCQNYTDLTGLISQKMLRKLEDAVSSVILGGRQNIAIRIEDLVYADVKGVKVTQEKGGTSVDVDILFVAIKMSRNVQLLIDLSIKFSREYGAGKPEDWNMTDLVSIHCRELLKSEH